MFFNILLFPLLLSAHLDDVKIPGCVGQYFKMNRSGPELVGVDVFQHPELGRTIKVVIIARRNRTAQDLAFAFTSAAAVANLMEREIDLLWVEMNVEYNGTETSHALAPVKCSIDALVFDGCDVDEFWKNCVEFP